MADLTQYLNDQSLLESRPSEGAFDLLPDGTYLLEAVETKDRNTVSGTGRQLLVIYRVVEGEHEGRKIYVNYNYDNASAQAVKIAWSELKALSLAIGCEDTVEAFTSFMQDTDQAIGIPFWSKVRLRPAGKTKDGRDYKAQNEISKYFPAGEEPGQSSEPATPAARANPAPAAARSAAPATPAASAPPARPRPSAPPSFATPRR